MIGRICTTAAVAIAMMLGIAGHVSAEPEKKDELSDRAVTLLMGMALSGMPDEMKAEDGKTVKIDKTNLRDALVPPEDGRRVIMAGRLSAYAQACDMPKLQVSNYRAFMRGEQNSKKWSRLQMIYMNRLHLFTVALMTGQLEATPVEEDGAKEDGAKEAGAKEAGAKKGDKKPTTDKTEAATYKSKIGKLTCPPERKEQVRKQIETFVEQVKKKAS